MKVQGFDHMVVNAENVDTLVEFYRDILGMEILRLDEFRQGKVGFVSDRVSPQTIIDIRPSSSMEKVTPNVDHFCLIVAPNDMEVLRADLKSRGIQVEEEVRPAWGAQGYGQQFKLLDPEGNKIELRCYNDPPSQEGNTGGSG